MPYRSEHMLLQWNGVFAQEDTQAIDVFTGTLRFAGSGISGADNQETADALAAALKTWWTTAGNRIPSIALLQNIKWNRIGTDGKYVNQTETRYSQISGGRGGSVGLAYPLQVNLCFTWATAAQRGRASRGRNYFPTTAAISGDNARLTASAATAAATSAADLIMKLNAAIGSDSETNLRASVMSNLGDGTTNRITRALVGNRLDIQRRRDNAAQEVYTESAIGG